MEKSICTTSIQTLSIDHHHQKLQKYIQLINDQHLKMIDGLKICLNQSHEYDQLNETQELTIQDDLNEAELNQQKISSHLKSNEEVLKEIQQLQRYLMSIMGLLML